MMIERIHPRHPHPNPKHVMLVYRGYLLGEKRKITGNRGIILRRDYLETYLWAKKEYLEQLRRCPAESSAALPTEYADSPHIRADHSLTSPASSERS